MSPWSTVASLWSVLTEVAVERKAQREKWAGTHAWGTGDCSSAGVPAIVKVAVLTEECGEFARAILDGKLDDARREAIQVAAVAVAIVEGLPGEPLPQGEGPL